MKIQKMKKLESLKDFQLRKEEANQVQGGRKNIVWNEETDEDIFGTFSIGTYVDGVNMGTDGYEDEQ